MIRIAFAIGLVVVFLPIALAQNTREQKVRDDKKNVEADGFWIYNDLNKAFLEAFGSKKPMIVVLRCIPCEECVKLDDTLLNEDPELHALLEKFVRVRVVATNGLDLGLFQFDYDQSFAIFLLNADGTIYGRFGTRSHRTEWEEDVSVSGLKKALVGALTLDANYPSNRNQLGTKRGVVPPFRGPGELPGLSKYTSRLEFDDKVVQSCIHCHMIGEAMKELERGTDEGISSKSLFPFPHPKSVGLILDPKECATVKNVLADSLAAQAGFEVGDIVTELADQPLLSIADVQWVLHQASPDGATLEAKILRNEKPLELDFRLPNGWRERDDISWRASSWGLRRMALGGLQLQPADPRPTGVASESMSLQVKHVGQYAPHDVAKKAGFLTGDVIISFDGRDDLLRETDVLVHALRSHNVGDVIPVTILRDGKKLELSILQQE